MFYYMQLFFVSVVKWDKYNLILFIANKNKISKISSVKNTGKCTEYTIQLFRKGTLHCILLLCVVEQI